MSHTGHPKHPGSPDTEARERARAVDDRNAARKERERLLDDELDDTFPASDPPSWTMGGSHVSQLRH